VGVLLPQALLLRNLNQSARVTEGEKEILPISRTPNWPDGHGDKVVALVRHLSTDSRLALTKLSWSTGLIVATRLED
jgi:hypothetical protein